MISRGAEEKALTADLANAYQLALTEVMLGLERTVGDGPPFVATNLDYPEMLRRTGWKILRHEDMGEGYVAMARRARREGQARAPAMRRELGETWVNDLLENDRRRTGAVLDSRLRRDLYVATPEKA